MRKIALSIAAAAVALTGTTLVAAPAEASTAPSITRPEARSIHKGDSMPVVKRKVGSLGRFQSSSPAYPSIGIKAERTYEYKAGRYGFVDVTYKHWPTGWKVSSKYVFFL